MTPTNTASAQVALTPWRRAGCDGRTKDLADGAHRYGGPGQV